MGSGSSVIEARPYLFTPSLGHWSGFYAKIFSLDDVVHHYTVQLGANATVGAPQLLIKQRLGRGGEVTAHQTWNLDMTLPQRMLDLALSTVLAVRGDRRAYQAVRAQRRDVLWMDPPSR